MLLRVITYGLVINIKCVIPDARAFALPINPLRKHAYSNILKILPPKNVKFQTKILIFIIFLLKT